MGRRWVKRFEFFHTMETFLPYCGKILKTVSIVWKPCMWQLSALRGKELEQQAGEEPQDEGRRGQHLDQQD
jgi:hypothetical protein